MGACPVAAVVRRTNLLQFPSAPSTYRGKSTGGTPNRFHHPMGGVSRRAALRLIGGGAAGLSRAAPVGRRGGRRSRPPRRARSRPPESRFPRSASGPGRRSTSGPAPRRAGRSRTSSRASRRAAGASSTRRPCTAGRRASSGPSRPERSSSRRSSSRRRSGRGGRARASSRWSARCRLLGKVDLMQVHNLLDLDTQLASIRAWKAAGRVRYVGVTHYAASAHAELARVLRKEKPDFVQVNYSAAEPEAGASLLPLAADLGVAVITNRPFGGGEALRRALEGAAPRVGRGGGLRLVGAGLPEVDPRRPGRHLRDSGDVEGRAPRGRPRRGGAAAPRRRVEKAGTRGGRRALTEDVGHGRTSGVARDPRDGVARPPPRLPGGRAGRSPAVPRPRRSSRTSSSRISRRASRTACAAASRRTRADPIPRTSPILTSVSRRPSVVRFSPNAPGERSVRPRTSAQCA